ncbi:MAG: hypothetical protein KatS3mg077_2326 [Candidatus Binatia bacterium]|nr:MAG: hypothetical protein KatS3mg077_2326 [Candidatus Binatia bacterium]
MIWRIPAHIRELAPTLRGGPNAPLCAHVPSHLKAQHPALALNLPPPMPGTGDCTGVGDRGSRPSVERARGGRRPQSPPAHPRASPR